MNHEVSESADFDWSEYDRLRGKAKNKCRVLKSARELYHHYEKNPNNRSFKDVDVRAIYLNSLDDAINALNEYLTFLKDAKLHMQLEQAEIERNNLIGEYERFIDPKKDFFKDQN